MSEDGAEMMRSRVGAASRVLLADAQEVTRRALPALLRTLGCAAVDVVRDGREALRAAAGGGYDLVLLDAQMPELDGPEAAHRIRADWPGRGRPRLVIMSAEGGATDRDRALAAGADDFLIKPLLARDLAGILAAERPPAATATAAPAPGPHFAALLR